MKKQNFFLTFQLLLGFFLFFISLLDKSIESNFFFGYSKVKTAILFVHLLFLIINAYLLYFYVKRKSNKAIFFLQNLVLKNNHVRNLLYTSIIVFTLGFYVINKLIVQLYYYLIFQKLFLLLFYLYLFLIILLIYSLLNYSSISTKRISVIYLFIIIFFTIFLNIRDNAFGLINSEWFESYQENCDSLIMGRLVNWNLAEKKDKILFMVQYIPPEKGSMPYHTEKLLNAGKPITLDDYSYIQVYTAQVGFQGTLFGLLSKTLFFMPLTQIYEFILTLSAGLLALSLTLILYWIYIEFSFFSLIVSWTMIILNSWITAGGKSTYWQYWVFYLGFILLLYYFHSLENGKYFKHKDLFIIVFFSTMLKFSMGFEYTTSFLIMLSIPFFYYEIKHFQAKREYIKKFSKKFSNILLTSLFSFLTSIGILLLKLKYFYPYDNEWNSAFDILYYRISKRTVFGDISIVNSNYIEGALTPLSDVIKTYLFEGIPLVFHLRSSHLIIIFIIFTVFFITFIKIRKRKLKTFPKVIGLFIATLLSLLSPLSWMILAKGHSADHTHFNYILFSMPFYFFLFIFLSHILQLIFIELKN